MIAAHMKMFSEGPRDLEEGASSAGFHPGRFQGGRQHSGCFFWEEHEVAKGQGEKL